LLAAVWLLLLAVTGSIIVFYGELDRALNRDIMKVAPIDMGAGLGPLPTSTLVSIIEDAYPGAYVSSIDLPNEPDDSLRVFLAPRRGSDIDLAPATQIFIDPFTGKLLAERAFGAWRFDRQHIMSWIHKFHRDLHLGSPMAWWLGLIALVWIVAQWAGAVMSFSRLQNWTRSFVARRGASGMAKVFDLHRVAGLWLLPVTLTLAVSGIYFNWRDEFRSTVAAVSGLTPLYFETAPRLAEPVDTRASRLDDAITAAHRMSGGQGVDALSVFPDKGLFMIRVFDADRDLTPIGQRYIHVAMSDATVLSDRHIAEGTAGDVFLAWQYPLHSGKAFGWWGRGLIFLAGMSVSWLCVSGILIWWNKQRQRTMRRISSDSPASVE
jgi:uncharacterized iron-regulated membrane protein